MISELRYIDLYGNLNTAFENKSRLLPPQGEKKKKKCGTRTHGSKLIRFHSNILLKKKEIRTSSVSSTNFESELIF